VAPDGGFRPCPWRLHVEEAGADAKLIQCGPLGVAYHRRHPISTILVARIAAHATVSLVYICTVDLVCRKKICLQHLSGSFVL